MESTQRQKSLNIVICPKLKSGNNLILCVTVYKINLTTFRKEYMFPPNSYTFMFFIGFDYFGVTFCGFLKFLTNQDIQDSGSRIAVFKKEAPLMYKCAFVVLGHIHHNICMWPSIPAGNVTPMFYLLLSLHLINRNLAHNHRFLTANESTKQCIG